VLPRGVFGNIGGGLIGKISSGLWVLYVLSLLSFDRSTAETDSQIPRNLRTMYVHAYQSYIWNLVTSERIKLSSTEPLVGDLVFADKSADDEVGKSPHPLKSHVKRD
jgi:tRNA(Glu) U13 pseudouridine synthase TruD